jgi:hypothetical protein
LSLFVTFSARALKFFLMPFSAHPLPDLRADFPLDFLCPPGYEGLAFTVHRRRDGREKT